MIHVYLTEPVDDKSMIIFKRNQENIFLLPMTNFTESAKWSTFHHPKIHSDVTNYLGPNMLPLLRNVYENQSPSITKYNNTKCEHGMG